MQQLGQAIGFTLAMSNQNCGVFFDQDEIVFEQLYIMADLGSSTGQKDAHTRMLEANCVGAQSG